MDWMKIATALPIGRSHRLNCWKCGRKNSASITNNGNNYVVHCFGCKASEVNDPPAMTPHERRAAEQAAEAFCCSEPALPTDMVPTLPTAAVVWITRGGLHVDDAARYGFGWSEEMKRVIMPVYIDGELAGVQARAVLPGMKPKYLGQVWSRPRPVWMSETGIPAPTVVLTEDILSAARVGKVCPAWSLLGTNLMPGATNRILDSTYTDVVVWMDDDEAGHSARRKILRQLSAVGIKARAVVSNRDPKQHSLQEIRDLIWHTPSI